jgi:hypothetical protein
MDPRNRLQVNGLFRDALESQKKDNTLLLHLVPLVHSGGLKYDHIFRRFFSLFYQGFTV